MVARSDKESIDVYFYDEKRGAADEAYDMDKNIKLYKKDKRGIKRPNSDGWLSTHATPYVRTASK